MYDIPTTRLFSLWGALPKEVEFTPPLNIPHPVGLVRTPCTCICWVQSEFIATDPYYEYYEDKPSRISCGQVQVQQMVVAMWLSAPTVGLDVEVAWG